MKTIPQSRIAALTDTELTTLLLDSGPLSPKTRERAEAETERRWCASTAAKESTAEQAQNSATTYTAKPGYSNATATASH